MTFAGIADREAIENEMPWDSRDVATTLYGMLSATADTFPNHKAISYQLFSDPTAKAETLTWSRRRTLWPMCCPMRLKPS
jgi:hypothetical protein